MSRSLGKHLVVELFGCEQSRLDDERLLRVESAAAAEAMAASVVAVHAHRFLPHGVSVVVVLRESHLTLHTWPEYGTASLDLFVCGSSTKPEAARNHLLRVLGATRAIELTLDRGQLPATESVRAREIPIADI